MTIPTSNSLIFGRQNQIPDVTESNQLEDKELRKRYKIIENCKTAMWNRWSTGYLKSLRERHKLQHEKAIPDINIGDMILIKGESKNRGTWKIGIVLQTYPGADGIVRAVQLKA